MLHPVPEDVRLVLTCNLFVPATALLIGVPEEYDCHVAPPSILDSYSSIGPIHPLPPLNVADTVPVTHTSETLGNFVIVCATGCAIVFQ